MEHKFLIDLSIKYGLDTGQISKVVDMIYQLGVTDIDSRGFKRIANYICEMNLIEMPAEELIEELKRKGFIVEKQG